MLVLRTPALVLISALSLAGVARAADGQAAMRPAAPIRPAAPTATDSYVWWEGESPAASTFPQNHPFAPKTLEGNAGLLSGGDWLNATGKGGGPAPTASWKIQVPADADYAFWVRKFWKHGPFKWRFDAMPADEWRVCSKDAALADDTPLKKHVNANWVSLGSVHLPKGPQVLHVELVTEPGKDWGAGFDCFVLSRVPFTPNGKVKPDEKSGQADEGFFAFEPELDDFRPGAELDLRPMNEPVAGEHGFVRREVSSLRLADGRPVRFFSINLTPENALQDKASVVYLSRKLAKLGVNMVRFHGPLWGEADPTTLDPRKLDALFQFVALMKAQGIYTTLSFYFPVWADGQKLGLEGFDGFAEKKPFGLLFFDPKLQGIYRQWARQLLTTKNPYTGKPLAEEPAVGFVEMLNEDSLFFWTFGKKNIPPAAWSRLEDLYNAWLVRKHGSLEAARASWQGERAAGDTGDRAALYEIFHLTSAGLKQGGDGKRRRAGDQTQFLAELQRNFYADTARYFRQELKVGSLLIPSNWTTADNAVLLPAERWSYTAADVVDSHGYFNPAHQGEGSAYSVRAGHTFADQAAVKNPGLAPLRFQQNADMPQLASEINFTQPNRYRSDGVLLAAAYSALQGVDGLYFFAVQSNYLRDASIQKFQVADPAFVQQFPAAALLYRRGDVREAVPAVRQTVSPEQLWAMHPIGGWTNAPADALRAKDIPTDAVATGGGGMDGYAPFVGPVVRSFAASTAPAGPGPAGPGPVGPVDLSRYIDRNAKTLLSQTGQLRWDYGKGLVTLNSDRTQAATGYLGASRPIELSQVRIDVGNEFATVIVAALDDAPILSSRRLLVQVMTRDQPAGFRVEGSTIKSLGAAPLGVQKIAGTVRLTLGPAASPPPGSPGGPTAANPTAVALDANGYATPRPVALTRDGQAVSLQLLPDAIYYLIKR